MLVKDNGGSCTVYFEGEINLNSINKFKEDIHTMDVEIEKDIILNFNQVSYINSLGLGAIIDLYKKSKVKKRGLTIVCNSPMIREVFEVVKFNKLIPIFNTDEEALG